MPRRGWKPTSSSLIEKCVQHQKESIFEWLGGYKRRRSSGRECGGSTYQPTRPAGYPGQYRGAVSQRYPVLQQYPYRMGSTVTRRNTHAAQDM
jgi:hypothetical protein